jgi:hypothetical protein
MVSKMPALPLVWTAVLERLAWTTAARGAVRPVAAFAVAAAMLLQLVLAAPLAMRMLPGTTSAAWPVVLCAMRAADGTSDHARMPSLPVSPHDHFGCPVCQGNAVPPGILAGAGQFLIPTSSERPWLRAAVPPPAPARPFRLYGSRAPPTLA